MHCARDRAWERIQSTPINWTIDDSQDIFELEEDKAANEPKAEVKQEQTEEDFTPIELPRDYSEPIDKLVLSYLQHHGYEKTAAALKTQRDARRKKAGVSVKPVVSKKEEMEVDIKMETDDSLPENGSDGPFDFRALGRRNGVNVDDGVHSRQRVVNAVLTGDIDLVVRLTQESFPSVLEADDGFLLLKLKCRKFVELILHASDALHAMKKIEANVGSASPGAEIEPAGLTREGAMDVDEEATQLPTKSISGANATTPVPPAPVMSPRMKRTSSRSVPSPAVAAYQVALSEALAYGKLLQAEMPRPDSATGIAARPEAQVLLKMTFSLVTYDDPRLEGGAVQSLCSQEARAKLAQEVNQAILGRWT